MLLHINKGLTSKGIFRKTAYRSRVSTLKELIETNPGMITDYITEIT